MMFLSDSKTNIKCKGYELKNDKKTEEKGAVPVYIFDVFATVTAPLIFIVLEDARSSQYPTKSIQKIPGEAKDYCKQKTKKESEISDHSAG